ncbi:CLAVATA3/ESR (CLE)-related protein 7-like [Hevea brasiliensis]|uniref:CLAVATA3/ESR (CLE)-related protein 7-like n=1 Tax=Hevea brasiliensis TaxID=3981 RepID=UPI0025E7BF41|nr:CLAVATA3/ESR (CLE)-related protein 7-like [Hevea brasiliensis]
MANGNATVMRASMLILLILSVNVVNLEALSFRGSRPIHTRIDSSSLLERLGYDLSKMKHVMKEKVMDTSTSRVSPGGPNPDHHSQPSSALP